MRKSLIGLAVAGLSAAAVATSAFTASNTGLNGVAGYGTGTISGATVTSTNYVPQAGDHSVLDHVVFHTSNRLPTGKTAEMTLDNGTDPVVASADNTCVITDEGDPDAGGSAITCTLSIPGVGLADFNSVSLTVY